MLLDGPLSNRLLSSALTLMWQCSAARTRVGERSQTIRPLLRRFPFWSKGHEILAEESLLHDNVACAYASALCMNALEPNNEHTTVQVNFILGRCYLRRGDWMTAHHYLEEASRLAPSNIPIQEEHAAALILGGELEKARSLLERIPETALSAEGKAARAFVRSRVS